MSKNRCKTIMLGGLAAGALDLGYAFLVFPNLDVSPIRILQSIASGLLGPEAYDSGLAAAGLGLMLHFLISTSMAGVFVMIVSYCSAVLKRPLPTGAVYGLGLFVVMYYIVVPLSASPVTPPEGRLLIGALFAHTVLVGIPIALITSRNSDATQTQELC